LVVKVATSALGLLAPNGVAPSLKVTAPVGFTPLRVTLKVMLWPSAPGLALAVSTGVVVIWVIVWAMLLELLGALFASLRWCPHHWH
jgi:hypothetical protein